MICVRFAQVEQYYEITVIMSKVKLTIMLIKSDYTDFDSIVHEGLHCITFGENKRFYYRRTSVHAPKWCDTFFNGQVNGEEELKVASVQAVLIVRRQFGDSVRFCAITFGFGRNLLRANVIESRFGLKTTLNSVDESQLRSIDLNTLESIPKLDRIQTSRLSKVNDFDIEEDRDLLRCITGRTKTALVEDLGTTISGSDSLRISVEATINSIERTLDVCMAQYNSQDYREKFDWIDNLRPVVDKDLISQLDILMLNALNSRDRDNLWMAIPEVIDFTQPYSLELCGGSIVDDLDVDEVIHTVYDDSVEITIPMLKARKVVAKNGDDIKIGQWNYYRCIYTEVRQNDSLYILNEGEWYNVESNYLEDVEQFYSNAAISNLIFPECGPSEKEGDYNRRYSASYDNYALMDCKLIPTGVLGNNIEFCDVLTTQKQLIHVKKGHSSSMLSHLFNQGYVAGELMMQRTFRQSVNSVLENNYPANQHLTNWKLEVDNTFNTSNYTMVYAIITNKDVQRPQMPFFSKVTFRKMATTLINMGYTVELKNIKQQPKPANNGQ